MKLRTLIIKNFRAYQDETQIHFEDLTAFIGRNDVGKSTILEALEIFFNNDVVKIENLDPCVHSQSKEVLIGCIFSEFPNDVVIDSRSRTTLKEEFLVNSEGLLEIHKVFDCSGKNPKEYVFSKSEHPSIPQANDLLTIKNADLKKRIESLNISTAEVDMRSNVSIRKAIWGAFQDKRLGTALIPLDQEDAKKIWITLEKELPLFALFQSDRKSRDEDSEVQDPMKIAISEALKLVQPEMDNIKAKVMAAATDVARRTLDKISEMDPDLASELNPDFRAEPKWDSVFKLTLTGDNNIPINKRGSGVRRMILLNFFRAEAERRQSIKDLPGIIFAIEEPETSQHPDNQRLLISALKDLAELPNTQVILTTHVPGLAGLIPLNSLRYVYRNAARKNIIRSNDDQVYREIARNLGVLPEIEKSVKVLFCVEGSNDISFFKAASGALSLNTPSICNLNSDRRLAFIPLGGQNLKQWVQNHYLRDLGLPEVHIYDRGLDSPPTYQVYSDSVNSRNDGSWAKILSRNELENYLHPEAINEVYGFSITITSTDDVPALVARKVHEASSGSNPWDSLDIKAQKKKEERVKYRLNSEVVSRMTRRHFEECDEIGELESILTRISSMLN